MRDVGRAPSLGGLVDAELGQQLRAEVDEPRIADPTRSVGVDRHVERDRPVGEHQHAVGEEQGLVDVVGDEQDRRLVPVPEALDENVHPDPGECVEGAERLVEQEQVGRADECPRQRDPLGLTAREGLRPVPSVILESHLGQCGQAGQRRLQRRETQDDVVDHRRPGQQARVLEDDGSLDRDLDHAVESVIEAGQGPQERALAGSAPPEQGDELARARSRSRPRRTSRPPKVRVTPRADTASGRADWGRVAW